MRISLRSNRGGDGAITGMLVHVPFLATATYLTEIIERAWRPFAQRKEGGGEHQRDRLEEGEASNRDVLSGFISMVISVFPLF